MKRYRDSFLKPQFLLLSLLLASTLVTGTFLWNTPTTGKTFSFLIANSILIVYCLIGFWGTKSLSVNRIDFCFLLFITYIGIQGIISNKEILFNHQWVEWLSLITLFLFIKHALLTNNLRLAHIQVFLLLAGVIQLIWGNLQLHGVVDSYNDYFKVTGTFVNPGPFAIYIGIIFPLALCNYLFANELGSGPVLRWISIVYLFLFIILIPVTESRAAWLACALASAFVIYYKFNSHPVVSKIIKSAPRKTLIVGFGLIVAVVFIASLYSYKRDSADGRLLIWKIATLNTDRIAFGHGFDSFEYYYNKYQGEYFGEGNAAINEIRIADYVNYAFNDFLQMIFEGGLLKFGIFCLLVVYCLRVSSADVYSSLMVKSAIVSFLVAAFFSYPLEILPTKIVLTIILGVFSYLDKERTLLTIRRPIVYYSVVSLTILFLSASILVNQYQAYRNWGKAFKYHMGGAATQASELYLKAYHQLRGEPDFLQSYGKNISLLGNYKKSNEILITAAQSSTDPVLLYTIGYNFQKMEEFTKAEHYFLLASNISPNRVYPRFLLAKLYFQIGNKEKFLVVANQILTMDIKVSSLATDQLKAEISQMMAVLYPTNPNSFRLTIPSN